MDQAQGAAGTGEAEQPTSTQPESREGGKEGKQEQLSPLQEAVRKELGIQGQAQEPSREGGEAEKPEEEEPGEAQPEEEQPAEDLPAAAEGDGEHEEAEEVPDNWPKTAKARVAEEARKRRERTEERDKWKATAETLHAQLQQATTQQLQPTRALSEVVDRQSLAAAEAHWTAIRRFALENPDGAYDVLVGKDAEGNEIRQDFDRAKIGKMVADAAEAFDALPKKRAFIAESESHTEVAKKVYPQLFRDTEIGREAADIVRNNPWILQHPDWALWVGDALTQRKMRLAKQGKNGPTRAGLSPGAQAILGAPKVTPAPGVIKSRSASGGPGVPRSRDGGGRVDDQRANEEFYSKGGTSEALEEKIKRKLEASQGGRTGGKQAALV